MVKIESRLMDSQFRVWRLSVKHRPSVKRKWWSSRVIARVNKRE